MIKKNERKEKKLSRGGERARNWTEKAAVNGSRFVLYYLFDYIVV